MTVNKKENQPIEQLTKKEKKELRYRERLEGKQKIAASRAIKRFLKIALAILVAGGGLGGLMWYFASRPPIPESEIISRTGIHWHPEVTILIKGKNQEISPNIGIGAVHQSVHTHDTSGVLHLEIKGLVRKDDTTLGRFFKIWGKEFNSNCIFDSCRGENGTVKMSVNGKENTEFENYLMKDKDQIEIRYE